MSNSFEQDYEKNRRSFKKYFLKLKGGGKRPPRVNVIDIVWAGIGVFLSMLIIFSLDALLGSPLLAASIGASAVLVFCLSESPFSQPRTVIGGHIVSALVGVTAYQLFSDNLLLATCFAVSFATILMAITETIHPPGGATALFAVIGTPELHAWGYWYVLFPCGVSAVILVCIGLFINNMSARKKYPTFWW